MSSAICVSKWDWVERFCGQLMVVVRQAAFAAIDSKQTTIFRDQAVRTKLTAGFVVSEIGLLVPDTVARLCGLNVAETKALFRLAEWLKVCADAASHDPATSPGVTLKPSEAFLQVYLSLGMKWERKTLLDTPVTRRYARSQLLEFFWRLDTAIDIPPHIIELARSGAWAMKIQEDADSQRTHGPEVDMANAAAPHAARQAPRPGATATKEEQARSGGPTGPFSNMSPYDMSLLLVMHGESSRKDD